MQMQLIQLDNVSSDNLASFFSGDLVATIITTVFVVDLNQHPLLKLAFIAAGGLFGGFFGLLGQRIFKYLEKKYDS